MVREIWNKADTHIHTTYSDGVATPEELVDYVALHTDLRVIAITDHDTAEGAILARKHAQMQRIPLEVIVGQEVTTQDGDVVGLFLTSTLPAFDKAEAAVKAIHDQGGLAIAVHPFSYWATLTQMKGVGPRILDLPLDGVEVRNGFPANVVSNPLTGFMNRRGQRLTELGGSDSHVPYTVGQPFTWFAGITATDLRRSILESRTRPGGTMWTPASMARIVPVVIKSGMPSMANKEVNARQEGVLQ